MLYRRLHLRRDRLSRAFRLYSASKFGLRGFAEALRRELADSGIRVLYVAPRATRTAMNADAVVAP
jgi:short-subunit dehydrogenase